MLQLEIIGNLGNNAVLKNINGKDYVSFDVAHAEGSGDQKTIVWVSCLWYGTGGNMLQYMQKGAKVFVRGRYSDSLFTRRDGTVGISRSVMVSEVQLCGSVQAQQRTPVSAQQSYAQQGYVQSPVPQHPAQQAASLDDDDDLPDFLRG